MIKIYEVKERSSLIYIYIYIDFFSAHEKEKTIGNKSVLQNYKKSDCGFQKFV